MGRSAQFYGGTHWLVPANQQDTIERVGFTP